jgi:hypothetical protein
MPGAETAARPNGEVYRPSLKVKYRCGRITGIPEEAESGGA